MAIFIGTAGWSIRAEHAERFDAGPSHLARYAARLNAVEINSSFYRPHLTKTYERWATSVPTGFRFSVKVPRSMTHEARLHGVEAQLDPFLAQIGGLGDRLGPLLVQLPPSLAFEPLIVGGFFGALRVRFRGAVVCEPRHASWFTRESEQLLRSFKVARVAADPARVTGAGDPGGWDGLCYFRWHGSPVIYRSNYGSNALCDLALRLKKSEAAEIWCIFDNTADGAAALNALALKELLTLERGSVAS